MTDTKRVISWRAFRNRCNYRQDVVRYDLGGSVVLYCWSPGYARKVQGMHMDDPGLCSKKDCPIWAKLERVEND